MATLAAVVFASHSRIVAGNLRNGDPTTIVRTARESALAPRYHWTAPFFSTAFDGNPVAFIPALPVAVLIDICCRCAFARLVMQRVADAAATYAAGPGAVAGAPAFDATAARNAAAADASLRVESIGVGSSRAASIASYRIIEADLVATEHSTPIFTLVAPAAAADAAAYAALYAQATAGWVARLASGHDIAAMTPEEALAVNYATITADEADLAFRMFSIGQAAPVRAGAQIYTDGHHYHSDETSSARHRAIENEVLNRADNATRLVWTANRQALRNAVWHAAIHPISAAVLQSFAEDVDMVAKLDATGYGSMSVGLPVQEDLLKRASAYQAVLHAVAPTIARHNHVVAMPNLAAAVVALSGLPRTGPLPAMQPALPNIPAAPWPANCTTRAHALSIFLTPFLDAAEPIAAWLFGYFMEVCSDAQIRRTSSEGSLLRSYALRRAMANHLAAVNEAQTMYRARARYSRAQAELGNLETYTATA